MENLPHFRRIDLVYFSLPGFESVFYEMAEGTSRKAVPILVVLTLAETCIALMRALCPLAAWYCHRISLPLLHPALFLCFPSLR